MCVEVSKTKIGPPDHDSYIAMICALHLGASNDNSPLPNTSHLSNPTTLQNRVIIPTKSYEIWVNIYHQF